MLTELCIHHHKLILEHPERNPVSLSSLCFLLSLSPWQPLICFLSLWFAYAGHTIQMESNSTGSCVTSFFHLAGFQGSFVLSISTSFLLWLNNIPSYGQYPILLIQWLGARRFSCSHRNNRPLLITLLQPFLYEFGMLVCFRLWRPLLLWVPCCFAAASRWPLSSCSEQGLFSRGRMWASHCPGFSFCGALALGLEGFSSFGLWALECAGFGSCGEQAQQL